MTTNILIFISGVIFGNLCSSIFNAIKVIYKNAYMEYTKSKKEDKYKMLLENQIDI